MDYNISNPPPPIYPPYRPPPLNRPPNLSLMEKGSPLDTVKSIPPKSPTGSGLSTGERFNL